LFFPGFIILAIRYQTVIGRDRWNQINEDWDTKIHQGTNKRNINTTTSRMLYSSPISNLTLFPEHAELLELPKTSWKGIKLLAQVGNPTLYLQWLYHTPFVWQWKDELG